MSTMTESNLCLTCYKSTAKYICIGCEECFCWQHVKEHEQHLSVKFDNEIVRSHDELLEQLQNSKYFQSDLFDQIERWKRKTIDKVEIAAEKARHKLIELIDQRRRKIKQELESIQKEIRCLQQEENYLENDIDRLRTKLSEIQHAFEEFIQQDPIQIIIDDHDEINRDHLISIQNEPTNCKYRTLSVLFRFLKQSSLNSLFLFINIH